MSKRKYTILYGNNKTKKIDKDKFKYPLIDDFLVNKKVIKKDIYWIHGEYLSHTTTTTKTPIRSLLDIISKKRILILNE